MLLETAKLWDWDVWSYLVIAGLLDLLCSCMGTVGLPPLQRAPAGRELPAPAAPCGARSDALCSTSLYFFLVSISLIIFKSRICSLLMEGLRSLTKLAVQ